MLTRQNALMAILIAPLLALWIIWQGNPEPAATVFMPQDSEKPDFYMKGIRLIATGENGERLHELTARTADHFPSRAQTEMNDVVLTYFRRPGAPWLMTALQAVLADDPHQPLTIKGNVHLELLQESLTLPIDIHTDAMNVWLNEQRAHSSMPVRITQGARVIAADALEGNLLNGLLTLDRHVKTTYTR